MTASDDPPPDALACRQPGGGDVQGLGPAGLDQLVALADEGHGDPVLGWCRPRSRNGPCRTASPS